MPASTLIYVSNTMGILGILICFLTGVLRLLGTALVLGFESMTLFVGGIALMSAANFVRLYLRQISGPRRYT